MGKLKHRVEASRVEIDILPLPLETKSYKPVAFGHVVDALDDALTHHLDELTDLGYTDTKATYYLNPKKTQMRYERSFHQPQGLLGIRAVAHTSSDKTMPIEYGAEGEVGVCSNGMVATQWQYVSARRHTRFRHLEYGMAANEAIQNLGPFIAQLEKDKAQMVERTLSADEFYGFMGRMWGHKVIGSNAINDIAKEWQNPQQRERMNQLHKIALTY